MVMMPLSMHLSTPFHALQQNAAKIYQKTILESFEILICMYDESAFFLKRHNEVSSFSL